MRDAVLLNAGAALAVHAAAEGSLEERLADGITRATEAVDSGAAQARARPLGGGDPLEVEGPGAGRVVAA